MLTGHTLTPGRTRTGCTTLAVSGYPPPRCEQNHTFWWKHYFSSHWVEKKPSKDSADPWWHILATSDTTFALSFLWFDTIFIWNSWQLKKLIPILSCAVVRRNMKTQMKNKTIGSPFHFCNRSGNFNMTPFTLKCTRHQCVCNVFFFKMWFGFYEWTVFWHMRDRYDISSPFKKEDGWS